jgi:2-polyprenyl-6-hydroxyphenyl methylase/3-demethylubiquinone-9 3-methyltransferase
VRHRLGPLEIPATELYRSAFINIGYLARQLAQTIPAKRILEVGCGDGSLAQKLNEAYPDASYVGIDIAASAGRLYRGDPTWAEFRTITVQELAAERPEPFDLVLLVDVIHHVSVGIRSEVLRASAELVRPGGHLAVKEFERNRGPYYHVTFAADRYLTGDRGVKFLTMPELRAMMASTRQWGFGEPAVSRIRPARNNVLFAARRDHL